MKAMAAATSVAAPSPMRNCIWRSRRCASRQGRRFIRGMSVEAPQGEAAGRQQRRGVALDRLGPGAGGQFHLAERIALLGGNADAAGDHVGDAGDVGAATAYQQLLRLLTPGGGG